MRKDDQMAQNQTRSEKTATLHAATDVSDFTLRVADLERSLAFYNQIIGLETLSREGNRAALGAGDRVIVRLVEVPGAKPASPKHTGLYHAAVLLPDRHALAVKVAQLATLKVPLGH